MTVIINIPSTVESRLQEEAARTGVSISTLIEDIVAERFHEDEQEDSLARLVASIGGTAPANVDPSREGIYADF